MTDQRLCKTISRQHAQAKIGDHRVQSSDILILCKKIQSIVDAGARSQQQGKVLGKERDVFRIRPIEYLEGLPER